MHGNAFWVNYSSLGIQDIGGQMIYLFIAGCVLIAVGILFAILVIRTLYLIKLREQKYPYSQEDIQTLEADLNRELYKDSY